MKNVHSRPYFWVISRVLEYICLGKVFNIQSERKFVRAKIYTNKVNYVRRISDPHFLGHEIITLSLEYKKSSLRGKLLDKNARLKFFDLASIFHFILFFYGFFSNFIRIFDFYRFYDFFFFNFSSKTVGLLFE